MNFSMNEIQQMLADSVEKFIANEYDFDTRQSFASSERGYSDAVWQQFAELGWTAVALDEADGGFGGSAIDTMVLMERFGRGLVVEPYLANIVLASGVLKRVASESQKESWLAPIVAGELQATLAFVEPQARYDITDILTIARQEGDHWIIDGAKGLVPNGGNAGLIIVPARTSGELDDESGITLFAVSPESEGVGIEAYETIDGHRAAELTLNSVRADAVIGDIDGGYDVLVATLDDAILAICAEALGIMNVLTEKTVEYTKSRVQFGVPISSFQALQHRMVDMYTACEQTRSLLMWATMSAVEGENVGRAVSSIKYQVGTAGRLVGEEAVQLHGGMGVTWELDVAHYFKRLIAITQILGNADWHLDQLAAG